MICKCDWNQHWNNNNLLRYVIIVLFYLIWYVAHNKLSLLDLLPSQALKAATLKQTSQDVRQQHNSSPRYTNRRSQSESICQIYQRLPRSYNEPAAIPTDVQASRSWPIPFSQHFVQHKGSIREPTTFEFSASRSSLSQHRRILSPLDDSSGTHYQKFPIARKGTRFKKGAHSREQTWWWK